jgi:ABC-type phosphate/phosphonate transport system substrate-binding protein
MARPVTLGAVLYDPKVSVIWEIICDFFERNGVPVDPVFFTNYERQVDTLIAGAIDIAWNSPLAWLDTQRRSGSDFRAVAMRDTDRDRVTCFVTRKQSGLARLADLRGRTVAMGAADSPQATLIPIEALRRAGLNAGDDVRVQRFDVLVGKHGDHVGGERDAFTALAERKADACAMLDLNWQTWTADGTIDRDEFMVLDRTGTFDHCVFAVHKDFPRERIERWTSVLLSMSYDNPKHREMMDMEGLKAWLPGRTSGFELLATAALHQRFFSP